MQVPKGLETIRLSQQQKDQLVRLKRATGIQHWNVLCRWAVLTSLADPVEPPDLRTPADSSVEMDWRTFAGDWGEVLLSLICLHRPDVDVTIAFRRHLARGILALVSEMPTAAKMVSKAANVADNHPRV